MNLSLLSIPLAYLLGSIPFGYLLIRIFRNEDIRESGSGNIGATNVMRSGARGLGIATLLLDLGKAFFAVRIAQYLAPGDGNVAMAAAVAAVLGHVYPVWLGFRGGKGVASALGVFLALNWMTALAILAVFLVVLGLTRYVSLASIVAAAALPLFALYFVRPMGALVLCGFIFLAVLVIAKHHANIRRLVAGTENRVGSGGGRKAAA